MAKNTGKGYRVGAVKGRSESKSKGTWFKRDNKTGRILNGSPASTRASVTRSDRGAPGNLTLPGSGRCWWGAKEALFNNGVLRDSGLHSVFCMPLCLRSSGEEVI